MRSDAGRARRPVLFFVALAVSLSLLPILPAEANHGECVLDVTPETASREIGDAHTMTATLFVHDSAILCTPPSTVTVHWENESGPNDPDRFTTRDSPDRFCTIPAGSIQPSCQVSYVGAVGGTDLWRAWLNHDNQASSFEGDPDEGRNAGPTEGSTSVGSPGSGDIDCGVIGAGEPEPDCTDVVEATFGGAFRSLDCDDSNGPDTERELKPSRSGSASNETYTCQLYRANGQPFAQSSTATPDVVVYGEIENGVNDPDPDQPNGANPGENQPSYNSPDYRCVTGRSNEGANAGNCQITVSQLENEDGTAEICFWAVTITTGNSEDPVVVGNEGRQRCVNEGEPTGEAQQTGSGAVPGPDVGNDFADQVELTWQPAVGNMLDAEPESGVHNINDLATIMNRIYNQFGTEEAGNNTVKAELYAGSPSDSDGNTPGTPDFSCTTNGNTGCDIKYSSTLTGIDSLCVWIGPDPVMTNTATTNPTCDGEGLNDADDEPGVLDSPEPNDKRDVIRITWQDATGASRLDCTPETTVKQSGDGTTVDCLATNRDGAPVSGASIDAEATGANDSDGNSPLSPDFSCSTDAAGRCSFTHGPGGIGQTGNPGLTTYSAWVDADNDNTSVERDATEGRNEASAPGSIAEPDGTDVTEASWQAGRTIDCEPETAQRAPNTDHTITCTVRDRSGAGAPNEEVAFTESGAGTITSSSTTTTNASGQATVTVRSSEEGTQNVTGSLTQTTECSRGANDPSGAPQGVCSDQVQVSWAASSTASPSPTQTGPFERRVTLTTSRNRVKHGKSFTLSGRVETVQLNAPSNCTSGVTVTIERDPHGGTTSFQPFATAVTNTSGSYSLNSSGDANATYVAKVADNQPPGCNAAQSSTENVLVRMKVKLSANRTRLNRPRNVQLTARLTPCEAQHVGTQVTLLRKNKGARKFRRVAVASVDGSCVARFRGRLDRTAIFRAKWSQQSQDLISGKSGKVKIRVS